MRLASGKFKHLDSIKPYLPSGSIPAFQKLDNIRDLLSVKGPLIMRSALLNEASAGELQSGKSISIGGIDSLQDLQVAWEKITSQSDLHEVILQEEIKWDTHVTLVHEGDFIFAELRKRDGTGQFLYWTPLAHTLISETEKLQKYVNNLKTYLATDPFWLMELGIKDNELFLFQLHPVKPSLLSTIFSSDMVAHMVASRLRFTKTQSLWGLLKTEWQARKFRLTMNSNECNPSKLFNNWEYLFHYFRIFCMINRVHPTAQTFANFLSTSNQKNWLSGMLQKHLELANYFRAGESFDPMKVGIEGQGPLFVGKGTFTGVVGVDIHVCDEISLDLIYRKDKARPQVILTKEVGILSHPVLASVENGVRLVLGLEDLPREGETIYLDFESYSIEVQ